VLFVIHFRPMATLSFGLQRDLYQCKIRYHMLKSLTCVVICKI